MAFLNPALLWGMLAVAVPIALHFWHQQRAKPMPWAMLRWLETPNQPPKRGFRFDNWLLLALRCMLLVALALLLARPVFPDKKRTSAIQAVHLVEPNAQLVEAYRFELAQALQRHERLYWATAPVSVITALNEIPHSQPLNPLTLQVAIDEATIPQTGLHLYVRNTPAWIDAPFLQVPEAFVLHPLSTPDKAPLPYVALPSGKRLAVGADGRLAVFAASNGPASQAAAAPLRVLIQFSNTAERQTIKAALEALTQVYGLSFLIDYQPVNSKVYTWILTDKPVASPNLGMFYTLTSAAVRTDWPNVQYLPGPLTPAASDDVANGQLPEQLGTQLIQGLGLSRYQHPLGRQAFAALFRPGSTSLSDSLPTTHPRNALQNGLLVLFLSLLLAERWLANRRGA
ncbi:BatA domain-containing protein [Fibrella sp. HMF5335]|uniref:BatA domain-containing protein n=1 Tax=Fibrella rubiginis TaxID=2817060 RepID=A0A939GDB0_9BACT|nr:BatA domain-containing protein [Fibrella rubiginis]MBO0935129.1 BatA domain-containing protein [Fibrella rubiginis]